MESGGGDRDRKEDRRTYVVADETADSLVERDEAQAECTGDVREEEDDEHEAAVVGREPIVQVYADQDRDRDEDAVGDLHEGRDHCIQIRDDVAKEQRGKKTHKWKSRTL